MIDVGETMSTRRHWQPGTPLSGPHYRAGLVVAGSRGDGQGAALLGLTTHRTTSPVLCLVVALL